MPQLIIDVTTEVAARMRTAYGVATNAELKTEIIKQIKDFVKGKEVETVINAEQAKIQAAFTARDTAIQTAETKANNEIVLS